MDFDELQESLKAQCDYIAQYAEENLESDFKPLIHEMAIKQTILFELTNKLR